MRIGFIKGVFGDIPHAVVTDNGNHISIKGLTSFGKTLADEVGDTKDALSKELPVGFVFTGFYEPSGDIPEGLEKIEGELIEASLKPRIDRKIIRQKNNIKLSSKSNILFSPIGVHKSLVTKPRAISFKARAFVINNKRIAFGQKIKTRQFIVNSAMSTIRPTNNAKFSPQHIDEAIGKYGRGFIRKSISALNVEHSNNHTRRARRRAKSLIHENTNPANDALQLRILKAIVRK